MVARVAVEYPGVSTADHVRGHVLVLARNVGDGAAIPIYISGLQGGVLLEAKIGQCLPRSLSKRLRALRRVDGRDPHDSLLVAAICGCAARFEGVAIGDGDDKTEGEQRHGKTLVNERYSAHVFAISADCAILRSLQGKFMALTTSRAQDSATFGQFIKGERIALRLTQGEVARRAKTRRENISALENGKNVGVHVAFAALAALGKALSVTDARPDFESVAALLSDD